MIMKHYCRTPLFYSSASPNYSEYSGQCGINNAGVGTSHWVRNSNNGEMGRRAISLSISRTSVLRACEIQLQYDII